MGRWTFTLLGLIVWAVHFLGVYAIASLADVVSRADDPAWRGAALAFSLACGLAAAIVLVAALRQVVRGEQDEPARFMAQLAALGAGLALVAIAWQGLPTLIGH